jgi:hypothetical protein
LKVVLGEVDVELLKLGVFEQNFNPGPHFAYQVLQIVSNFLLTTDKSNVS